MSVVCYLASYRRSESSSSPLTSASRAARDRKRRHWKKAAKTILYIRQRMKRRNLRFLLTKSVVPCDECSSFSLLRRTWGFSACPATSTLQVKSRHGSLTVPSRLRSLPCARQLKRAEVSLPVLSPIIHRFDAPRRGVCQASQKGN